MGDTGSEGSKPPSNVNVIPPRCPCGFWGSSKTMNLCSKCFADIQKKQPDNDCAPKASSSSSSSSQADIFCNETNSSISQSLMSVPNASEDPSPGETGVTSLPAQDEVSSTDTVFGSLSTPTKRSFESASESESDVSPEKRARVGVVPESEESSSSSSSLSAASSSSSSSSRSGSKQRSRKRCHRCQTKLELVQQELGSCRCGYVFCMLHRLPEQHECLFDHLGRGRQEAVLKMVKLDRKDEAQCQDWVATRSMRSVFTGGCGVLERDLGDKMLWPVVSNLLTAQQTRKPAILTTLIGCHHLSTPTLVLNKALLNVLSSLLLRVPCLDCYYFLSLSFSPQTHTLSKPLVCTAPV
ncbi:AN1-type zinc finger protein 3-like isoform X1 [Toxotes jaculatrix]|uniref:AN1-type zinc finger protein 3-like isoform X1 n=1 Tax=Toxotes jaculatrix TaxID=941984 RepID=UPI001B3B1B25|nr:AN1-type zinc finger protein 3-like isoform X1 [Toxotes jaculatrix]